MNKTFEHSTPWRHVFVKFGMSQSAFARALNRHRSKISRVLKDNEGLINGKDQKHLLAVARELQIPLKASDLMPRGR